MRRFPAIAMRAFMTLVFFMAFDACGWRGKGACKPPPAVQSQGGGQLGCQVIR